MSAQNINILLVEDEAAHAELVQRAFERQDGKFQLSITETIANAKVLLQETTFSLVLTDWRLPDGEGTELIDLPQGISNIPVIIMTSHGNERVAVEAIKSGALDYVVKSDAALADMAHIVERALREWDNILQRQHAEEQLRHRVAELEAVNSISTALRSAETLQEIIPRLMDETLAIINAQGGIFWLYDANTKMLTPITTRGSLEEVAKASKPMDCISYQAFKSGQPHFVNDFSKEKNGEKFPKNWGGACIPIKAAKEVLGVMLIGVTLPRELAINELHLLTTISEIAGNAIHRTQLHEQTQRNLKKLAALRAIDQAITSSIDLNLSLNILVEHAKSQLNVDAVAISRLDPNTQYLELFIGRGFHSPVTTNKRMRLGNGLAGQAALEQRPVFAADISGHGSISDFAATATNETFRAYYVAPMVTKGLVKGILEIFNRSPLQPDHEWTDFLEALAGQAAIAIENTELFESLEHSNLELKYAYDATIEGWSRALDLRDRETEGHTQRVTQMALALAETIGVDRESMLQIRRGALLHDIGKMGIPDQILFKEGPLDEHEWEIMRMHPVYAYEMLSPIKYLAPALDIPYCHHEFWDGNGYPRGLKGEQIPLAARIFAVADVWDALRSNRPYREHWSKEAARNYILEHSGTQFDPQVVDVFARIF